MATVGMESSAAETAVPSRRVEIDTRAPFRSVKEAVVLFGEKVLAGEVYANRLNELRASASRNESTQVRLGSIIEELEETRQNLEKANEERQKMVNCLSSLKEELDRTRMELNQLKTREHEKQVIETEIRDIRFVDNFQTEQTLAQDIKQGQCVEFQKKRYVTFANPPSLARVMNAEEEVVLQRQASVDKESFPKKTKKKSFIPLVAALLTKRKKPSRRQCTTCSVGSVT